jgi:hypothetical protein
MFELWAVPDKFSTLMSGVLDAVVNLFLYAVDGYLELREAFITHRDTTPRRIDCFDLAKHLWAARGI